jgi:hypothetical protein
MSSELRTPRATAGGFSNNTLDSATIALRLNEVPIASMSGNPSVNAKYSAINALDAVVFNNLKQLQAKKFAGGSQKVYLTMSDGSGGGIGWSGLFNGPTYQFSSRSLQFGTNAIDEVAKLQQLKTDIYVKSSQVKSGQSQFASGTIHNRLKEVLEKKVSAFQDTLEMSGKSGLDKEALIAQHEANQEPLKIWYSILNASSKADNPGLFAESYLTLDESIEDHISKTYLNGTSNFFDTMMQFCTDFRLVYVPPTGSGYGQLVGIDKIFNSPTSSRVILTDFSASISGYNVPPVNAVWVVGKGNIETKSGQLEGDSQIFAIWPPTEATQYSGRVQRVPPPIWLPNPAPLNVDVQPTKSLKGEATLSILKIQSKKLEGIEKINFNILQEWARLWFIDLVYGNETTTISMPLDLSWAPGTYCNVSSGGGDLLKGLVNAVRHDLSVTDASTTVEFTHVQYT